MASARATASRISLTPASTAEMAMNSALNASAIRRASVVLPTPGGPQRIIECSLPDRERHRERLARRQQVPLSGHLRERLRTQAFCQRRCGAGGGSGEEVVHAWIRMVGARTSTPPEVSDYAALRGPMKHRMRCGQVARTVAAGTDLPSTIEAGSPCATTRSRPSWRQADAPTARWYSSSSRRACRRSAATPARSSCCSTWSTPGSRSRRSRSQFALCRGLGIWCRWCACRAANITSSPARSTSVRWASWCRWSVPPPRPRTSCPARAIRRLAGAARPSASRTTTTRAATSWPRWPRCMRARW